MKQKFGISQYGKPTPKKWRKLGDALLAFSTMISGSMIMTDHKWIALGSVLVGAFGKFLTNFFSEE